MAGNPTMKVGLGVEGADSFRAAMRNAQQSVRQLDAELKLSAAQYKATGDQEQYMSSQTDLLNKQIAEQNKVIENAEKLLAEMKEQGKENTDTYAKMTESVTRYKTGLATMQAKLKEVGQDLDTSTDKTEQLGKTLESIDKKASFASIQSGLKGIGSTASSALSAVNNLAKSVWNMELDAAQYADDVATLYTQYKSYGISLEEIQQMQKASDLADVTAETLLGAMAKLQQTGNKVTDSKSGKRAFDALGIDTTKSWAEQFYQTIDLIGKITDENQKNALSMELFGRNFAELGTIAESGSEAYKALLSMQEVSSEEDINKLVSFSDAIAELNGSMSLFKNDLAASIAEPMSRIAGAFKEVIDRIDEWVKTPEGQAALDNLADSVAGLFEDLANTDFSALMDGAVEVLNGITSAFRWISNNWETVKLGIEGIVGGFLAFKGVKIASDVLQLITGLTSLMSGGGLAAGLGSLASSLGTIAFTAAAVTIAAESANLTYNLLKANGDPNKIREAWDASKFPKWMYSWLIDKDEGVFSDANINEMTKDSMTTGKNDIVEAAEDVLETITLGLYKGITVDDIKQSNPISTPTTESENAATVGHWVYEYDMKTGKQTKHWVEPEAPASTYNHPGMIGSAPYADLSGYGIDGWIDTAAGRLTVSNSLMRLFNVMNESKFDPERLGAPFGEAVAWNAGSWSSESLSDWSGVIETALDDAFGEAVDSWSSDSWASEELSDWGGSVIESIGTGIEENLSVLEAAGSAIMSSLERSIVRSASSYGSGGYNSTANVYVENMNMNGGADAEGLATAMQKQLLLNRRGFGG